MFLRMQEKLCHNKDLFSVVCNNGRGSGATFFMRGTHAFQFKFSEVIYIPRPSRPTRSRSTVSPTRPVVLGQTFITDGHQEDSSYAEGFSGSKGLNIKELSMTVQSELSLSGTAVFFYLTRSALTQREKVHFYILEIHSGLLHIVNRSARLTIWSSPECISRT